jgi:hypothetical protein
VFSRALALGEEKGELYMKVSRLSTLLLGSSLLLSVSAFAGTTMKKSLHLYENVTVEGKQLSAGDYKCEWSGSGPDVKVNILKGKEIVASVSARIVSQKNTIWKLAQRPVLTPTRPQIPAAPTDESAF